MDPLLMPIAQPTARVYFSPLGHGLASANLEVSLEGVAIPRLKTLVIFESSYELLANDINRIFAAMAAIRDALHVDGGAQYQFFSAGLKLRLLPTSHELFPLETTPYWSSEAQSIRSLTIHRKRLRAQLWINLAEWLAKWLSENSADNVALVSAYADHPDDVFLNVIAKHSLPFEVRCLVWFSFRHS